MKIRFVMKMIIRVEEQTCEHVADVGGDGYCLNKMSEIINGTDHFEVLVARMVRFKMKPGD